MDHIAVAALIIAVMFMSMRLLYGYWPWQLHPKLRRQRERVVEELKDGGFNFEPVAAGVEGAFRPVPMASGIEPDPTKSPPFHIGGSMAQRPPLKVEIVKGEDNYDRGHNDNGKTESQGDSTEGMAHSQEDEAGEKGVHRGVHRGPEDQTIRDA
jgi:hypothetical protein